MSGFNVEPRYRSGQADLPSTARACHERSPHILPEPIAS